LNLRIEQRRATVADGVQQREDRRLVDTRHSADCPDAHAFSQQREDLDDADEVGGMPVDRLVGTVRFRKRRTALLAAVSLNGCLAVLAEPLNLLMFTFRTGHDRPLAGWAGRADNRVEVWIVRP
jgi:hypothetical protein